jgi:hypothetical protein
MNVIQAANIFFKFSQTIPAANQDTSKPEGFDRAYNSIIFLVKNNEPFGPLEWWERYVKYQVAQGETLGLENNPMTKDSAAIAAHNLTMTGRLLLQDFHAVPPDFKKGKIDFNNLEKQYNEFKSTYMKWLTTSIYPTERKKQNELETSINLLDNFFKNISDEGIPTTVTSTTSTTT